MQTRFEKLKSDLEARAGQQAKLSITFGESPACRLSEDGGTIYCSIPANDTSGYLKDILELIEGNRIATSKVAVDFKDRMTLEQRSTSFYELTTNLHCLNGIKSVAINGGVKDYVMQELLKHKNAGNLSHLEMRADYLDDDKRTPVNKKVMFEEYLVEYLKRNPRLKTLTIDDMHSLITAKNNPELKKAICEHPRLISYNQGWGDLLNRDRVSLDKDSDVQKSFADKKARDPKVIKDKLDKMLIHAVDYANGMSRTLEMIIVMRKQVHPNEDTWNSAAIHLDGYIRGTESLVKQMQEFSQQTSHDYSREIAILPALIQYATLLKMAAVLKSALGRDKKLEHHADTLDLFWDITRPKIDKIVQEGNAKELIDSCAKEYAKLSEIHNSIYPPKAKNAPSSAKAAATASATEDPDKQLDDSITALREYGEELKRKKYPADKYNKVLKLADDIQKQVADYREKKTTRMDASENLKELIKEGKKQMRGNRRALDIIGHIGICLTGIGLMVLGVRWLATGKFFINTTEREKKLKTVSKSLKKNNLR